MFFYYNHHANEWSAARNIHDDEAIANLANISHMQIKVDLQNMASIP